MHYQVLTQWAKAEAASRTAIHDELSSQRKLSDGFESIGVLGEIECAIQSGLALPLDPKIFSDAVSISSCRCGSPWM